MTVGCDSNSARRLSQVHEEVSSSSSSPCEQSPTTQTCSLSSKHPPSRNWVRASPAPTLPGIGSGHPRPPLYQELGQGIPGPHFTRNWVRASPAPTLPGIGSGHPRPPLYQELGQGIPGPHFTRNWVRASPAPTLPGIGSGHPRPPLHQELGQGIPGPHFTSPQW